MIDFPLYGRISVLKLFRPKRLEKDVLFVLTERYQFCVLEYVKGEKILSCTETFRMFLRFFEFLTLITSCMQVKFLPEPMEICQTK